MHCKNLNIRSIDCKLILIADQE